MSNAESGVPRQHAPDTGPPQTRSQYQEFSVSGSFLYLGLRSDFGTMTRSGLTVPTRSRALARTSLPKLNFFLRGTALPTQSALPRSAMPTGQTSTPNTAWNLP